MEEFSLKISKEQVENVAHLARLSLTEEEKAQMTKDMEAIITMADQLNELEIGDIEPTAHVIPIQNVFREDKLKESLDREKLLSNAPSSMQGCFSVPKIVE